MSEYILWFGSLLDKRKDGKDDIVQDKIGR